MNKKLIFSLIIICIAVVSISSVNAFWPVDSGSDITVNDVKFHIPDGFEEVTSEHEITKTKEKVVYKNDKEEELSITVLNNNAGYKNVKEIKWGTDKLMIEKTISGKEGLASYRAAPFVFYTYLDNDKLVMMDCPMVFDDATKYEDFLEKVIV